MRSRSIGVVVVALLAALASVESSAAADPRDPRDPVRLRIGTLAIDGSRYMKDIIALGKEVEKRTRGAVQLDWVSGGQLGDEAAMADLIVNGQLDGGGFSETGLAALVPEMAVWGSPGLFRTDDDVDRATSALDATTRDLFAKQKLMFVMWADLGFTEVFATAPVASLRDLLTTAAPWLTLPLAPKLTEEITSARARAWTLPPLYMLAIGRRTARAMTDIHYRYVVGALVFSGTAWARLGAADQATVLETCRAWQPKLRASWRKESERGIAALAKAGIATRESSNAEVAAFLADAAKARAVRAKQLGIEALDAKIVTALSVRD